MSRSFCKDWPLGQIMAERGLKLKDLVYRTDIDTRRLSDYLANRVPFQPKHLHILADTLECDVEELLPDEAPKYRSRVTRYDSRKKSVARGDYPHVV